ncbi:MAG TPA: acetylxylan esterase [Thermomicrobiales bacterium]|nr:acetylxylan esterase [Thermomicrobiales bacterium]
MRPPNFDGYWENIDAELEAIPARPLIEEIPLRSNEHAILYGLRLTSIGPYRIFGYLSVPRGEGPFPALYLTPWYGSVNHIPDYNDRMRYVCLQIMHRGQRLADQPYSAAYPGLLTEGIDDPEQYAFRGIAADCLRGAEYLLSHPAVDTGRVAIQGDDLALIVAARRGGFGTVVIDDLLFYRLAEARATTSAYPIEEVNDYLRANPDDQDDVEATLALFDPLYHAASIDAHVILAVDDDEWCDPLLDELGDRAEVYRLTHRGRTDNDELDRRLAARLGAPVMSRFARAYRD